MPIFLYTFELLSSQARKSNAPLVTIVVGAESAIFVVHREVISYHSPFFKAAFESSMIEGQTQRMTLEDIDSEVFGLLVHWLYTLEIEGEESMVKALHEEDSKMTSDASVKLAIRLAKLWVLAERFIICSLRSQVNSLLTSMPGPTTELSLLRNLMSFVLFVYTEITGPTELRDIAVNLMIDKMNLGDVDVFKAWIYDLPHEALVDLTAAMGRGWHTDKMQLQYGGKGQWRNW